MHVRRGSPCSLSRSPSPPTHVPNRIPAAGLAHAVWNARGADGRLPRGTIELPPIERAGRGGRGGAAGSGAAPPPGARFERLDLLRLELEDRDEHEEGVEEGVEWNEGDDDRYLNLHEFDRSGDDEGDGGEDGEEEGEEDDEEEDEEDEEEDEAEEDDEAEERPCRQFVDDAAVDDESAAAARGRRSARENGRRRRRSGDDDAPRQPKRPAVATVSTELMTSLFGPQSTAPQPDEREADGHESEDDSVAFGAPSDGVQASRLRTERELFSVPGVACVGCCLGASRLRHLDTFVGDHATSTQPEALWRLAASVYVDTVVAPCRREGVVAPPWSKEGVRIHYEHHALYSKLTRVAVLREMRGVREMIVRRLVRVDDDGEREADHKTTEQYLKMVAAESREHTLLLAMDAPVAGRRGVAATGRGGGGGRAAAPAGGDAGGGDAGAPADS